MSLHSSSNKTKSSCSLCGSEGTNKVSCPLNDKHSDSPKYKFLRVNEFDALFLPKNSSLYYGSAQFKELFIDSLIHSTSIIDFPTDELFFLSTLSVASKYSYTIKNVKINARGAPIDDFEYLNFNNIFKYITKSDLILFDLSSFNNITKLLTMPDSPFSIARALAGETIDINVDVGFYIKSNVANIKFDVIDGNVEWLKTYGLDFNEGKRHPIYNSGMALLIAATRYNSKYKVINRNSRTVWDYHVVRLTRDFLDRFDRIDRFDGFYQAQYKVDDETGFHEEFCISYPRKTLKHDRSFIQHFLGYQSFNKPLKKIPPLFKEKKEKDTKQLKQLKSCSIKMIDLMKEMELYANAQNEHHVGLTILDHSIWVTRTVFKWMTFNKHPFTGDIKDTFRNATLTGAFVHDIGKIGDRDTTTLVQGGLKSNHPDVGYQYLNDHKLFKTLEEINDVESYIQCIMNDEINSTIIKCIVAMHHYFGFLIKTPTASLLKLDLDLPELHPYDNYQTDPDDMLGITALLSVITEFKYIVFMKKLLEILFKHDANRFFLDDIHNMEQLITIIVAVSAADVYGAYPVQLDEKDIIDYMPLLTDVNPVTLVYKTEHGPYRHEMNRPYIKYLTLTLGVDERNKLVQFAQSISNYRLLYDAWDGFYQYSKAMTAGNYDNVPGVFEILNTCTTVDSYTKGLLRLLKSGELPKICKGTNTKMLPAIHDHLFTALNDDKYKQIMKMK